MAQIPLPVFPTTIRTFQSNARNDNAWPILPRSPFGVCLFRGDSLKILADLTAGCPAGIFDMVFADPPYRLSNGGITCKSGKVAPVDKGAWDRSRGLRADYAWNRTWLRHCQRLMKPDATIWVTGTQHAIFLLGFAMRELGMKILNVITWEKPDPPPNLSCRYFTHSTEFVIWAGKNASTRHRFNDGVMQRMNGGQPMQTVWRIAPPGWEEKRLGRHPTQKPVALVRRAILASTTEGDVILDPFIGSGTTAVAAVETGRQCVGLEDDEGYLKTAARRTEAARLSRPNSRPIALAG